MARIAVATVTALALALGASAPAMAAAPAAKWSELRAKGAKPGPRRDHALAATSSRYVWLFGGRAGGRALDDLWRLDLRKRRWSRIRARGAAPPPRFGHNLAGDSRGRLLLFGGQAGGVFRADAWRFDPRTRRWSRTRGDGPRPRYGAAGAYDKAGDRLVISHGFTDQGRFDDTWATFPAFSQLADAEPRPIKRCLVSGAVFDGGFFIFGGQTDSNPFLGDLWRLDLQSGAWRELEPANRPSGRNLYAAARLGSTWLLHGGADPSGLLGELWALDLETARFTAVAQPGAGPGPRLSHSAATAGNRIVIFGGATNVNEAGDTWVLRLSAS